MKKKRVIISALIVGFVIFVIYSDYTDKQEKEAEQQYLNEHPLTETQLAANKHFNTCWQYAHMPSSVWSDQQRNTMLAVEGCHSDDRDDPRYGEATYPWNANAPHPWNDGSSAMPTSSVPSSANLIGQEKLDTAKDAMTRCLQRLPAPQDGTEQQVEKVIRGYVTSCGQDYLAVWRQAGSTEEQSMAMAVVEAYKAMGCRYSNPTQVDMETKPQGGRSVTCSAQSPAPVTIAREPEPEQTVLLAEDIDRKGYDAFNRGDYGGATYWFRLAATQGNAYGQNYLGYLYENGLGVPQNVSQAIEWYRKAAAQGEPTSQANLKRLGVN